MNRLRRCIAAGALRVPAPKCMHHVTARNGWAGSAKPASGDAPNTATSSWISDVVAPAGTSGSVAGKQEAPGMNTACPDSWDRPDPGGPVDRADPDPHRFRTKRQLWTYSGLGLETHDSAQYRVVEGQLRSKKSVTLRGLNQDHNHDLKDIFKGAATRVSSSSNGPLHDFYEHLLAQGRKPTMAA